MNKRIVLSAGCLATLSAIGLAHAQGKRPLRVVSEVDLARYAGQCYEIARYPNRFQKRCAGEVTAQYTLQPSGKISVLNRCRLENGGQIQAEGGTCCRQRTTEREYLWILSRSPQMDGATYNRLVDGARMQGFDVSRMQKTRQAGS